MAAPLERAVRLSAVPPHLAATLRQLPRPIGLTLTLQNGDGADLPPAARQLLKLALRGDGVELTHVRAGGELVVDLPLEDRRCRLSAEHLAGNLRAMLPELLLELFGPSDIASLLDELAFASSSLATLRKTTSRMLAASDTDLAYRLFLRGLTAGFGLGFHRAAVLLRVGDAFVGAWAEGPLDELEAHRVWESLELEDVDVDRTLDGANDARPSPLAELARSVAIDAEDPWIRRVLGAPSGLLLQPEERGPLAPLDVRTPFVVAALKSRGAPLGIVFADHRFGGSINPDRLQHLDVFVDQAALVVDNLRLFERVASLARTDPLTGLANRRELDARFALLADKSTRAGMPLSLLVIDVDHFKAQNDALGHEAGDELLKKVAALLEQGARAGDALARFGGDEFVLLLPGTERAAVAAVARRIGRAAREAGVSLSLGAATYPVDAARPHELFRSADAALYRSKAAGRGCCHVGQERIDFD